MGVVQTAARERKEGMKLDWSKMKLMVAGLVMQFPQPELNFQPGSVDEMSR